MASKHIATMQTWIDSLTTDVKALEEVIKQTKVPKAARKYAVAGLNYLLLRLDIIPDSQPATGVLDDAFILRVAAMLASDHDLTAAGSDAMRTLGRLSNDTDVIKDFFGSDIFGKIKLYTERLAEQEVRRRTPETILTDATSQAAFFREVGDELKHFLPAPQVKDADAIERELKSYFKAKLAAI